MNATQALKEDDDLFLKKRISYDCAKYMSFEKGRNLWIVEEKRGSEYLELLETESEEEAVAKLLEDDDAGL